VTPFVRYDYNEEIFTQPGVHTNAITVSYTDGDNREPRVSPIATDAVYHITITVIEAVSLNIELSKNEFKTIDNDIAKAAIKTANVTFADSSAPKSILSSLTAYDPEHDTGNVIVDTGSKKITVSWNGLEAEIVYFLTGDINLLISVKDFYDVSIKTIELGAIHILNETPPTVELSGDSNYTSIKWYLNGVDTGKTAREYEIVLGASAKIGRNVLSVEVVLDGVTYRKNIVYTVIL
ncbi:MAG: hypothetical protein FWB73_07100, partial [Treponema sp.]|nr:hypothetical protein [Treponema sp.]